MPVLCAERKAALHTQFFHSRVKKGARCLWSNWASTRVIYVASYQHKKLAGLSVSNSHCPAGPTSLRSLSKAVPLDSHGAQWGKFTLIEWFSHATCKFSMNCQDCRKHWEGKGKPITIFCRPSWYCKAWRHNKPSSEPLHKSSGTKLHEAKLSSFSGMLCLKMEKHFSVIAFPL